MNDSLLKKYYEENIQKGYAIDQITNNLMNNGYSSEDLNNAIALLSPEFIELSKRNLLLFDNSFVGNNENLNVNQNQNSPNNNNPSTPNSETGISTQTKIQFGVVLGVIFLIIVFGSVLLVSSSNNQIESDFNSGSQSDDSFQNIQQDDDFEDSEITDFDEWDAADDISDDYDDFGTNDILDSSDMDGIFLKADELGLNYSNYDCNDFNCLQSIANACNGSASILGEFDIRPFTLTHLSYYNFKEVGDYCFMSFKLGGYRRSYTEDEIFRMMEFEDLSDSEIMAEQDEIWDVDRNSNLDHYYVLCRSSDILNFVTLIDSFSDGYFSRLDCPVSASTGKIFDRINGIAVDHRVGNRTCTGDDLWSNFDCVKYDVNLDIGTQFQFLDDAAMAEFGDLSGFESTTQGFVDTRGNPCDDDNECFDGDVMTINYCKNSTCRVMLDDGRECVSGDNFCPERCYGLNITDCKDFDGNRLCSDDDHCDDGDEYTEGICRQGSCTYFDVDPPNKPPVFESYPTTIAYHDEIYEFQVKANSPEGYNLTYSLSREPSGMTINETSGLIEWLPDIEDYFSGEFSVIASDGIDTTEHKTNIIIYLREEEDNFYQDYGDSSSGYFNMIFFLGEYHHCKYLDLYWDEPSTSTNDCLISMAVEDENSSICDYILDADKKSECHENI